MNISIRIYIDIVLSGADAGRGSWKMSLSFSFYFGALFFNGNINDTLCDILGLNKCQDTSFLKLCINPC